MHNSRVEIKMINILVPIANGTEEMEAVIIIDILRRAAFNVTVAGENDFATCSRNVKIIPDTLISKISENTTFDAIILPGGLEGTKNLSNNKHLIKIIKKHKENNKLIGAICAAPTILAEHNIFDANQKLTSHPSVKEKLNHYQYTIDNVCIDGIFITSRGAGTAIDFALEIVKKLSSKESADKIASSIVYKYWDRQ